MKSSYNLLCFGTGDSVSCSIVTVIKVNKDKWRRHHKTDACVSACCKSIYRCLKCFPGLRLFAAGFEMMPGVVGDFVDISSRVLFWFPDNPLSQRLKLRKETRRKPFSEYLGITDKAF